jgi:hypothetical protein
MANLADYRKFFSEHPDWSTALEACGRYAMGVSMLWASRREKNAPANIRKASGSTFEVVHGKTALAKMFEPSGLPVILDPGASFAAITAGLVIISFKTNELLDSLHTQFVKKGSVHATGFA